MIRLNFYYCYKELVRQVDLKVYYSSSSVLGVVKSTYKTKSANKSLTSYLIKRRKDVVSKLDFSDGGGPSYSKSDSEGNDALLTQWTVKHPITACQPKQEAWSKNADVLIYLLCTY